MPVERPQFDPAVASQLTAQLLTSALEQQQLNSAQARNMLSNSANVMTLGVQINNAAMLQQLTRMSPMAAAVAAQAASMQTGGEV